MTSLHLQFLGPPRVLLDGQPVKLGRRKALALLAYLAVSERSHARDSLAALFWPESDQKRARTALRSVLSALGRTLGGAWLRLEHEQVELAPHPALSADAVRFRQEVERAQRAGTGTQVEPALEQAIALYAGDFLAGFSLRDAPEFDHWQAQTGAKLRQTLATALALLTNAYTARGAFSPGIDTAQRRLALDPLHEDAHRALMRIYALAGRRHDALQQYHTCAHLLEEELGLSPDAATQALFREIEAGMPPPSHTPGQPTSPPTPHLAPATPPTPAAAARPLIKLPRPQTSFVGRDEELGLIRERLLHTPHCRLLTLIGPGGSGKTRLAIRAAAQCADSYRDGVLFIPLAEAETREHLVLGIGDALGLVFAEQIEPTEQIIAFLQRRTLLLVLDNFEQLLAHADLIARLLAAAPALSLLVTSRERLHLQAEWLLDVPGLTYPRSDAAIAAYKNGGQRPAYSAPQLFAQRAARLQARFSLDRELDAVLRVCHLTEGIPLALEMAAAWIRVMPCAAIAAELAQGLDDLQSDLADTPARHRSLRALFEQTWGYLSPPEREHFARLSIFRGGFERSSAEEVAGVSLSLLASLADKSLVRVDAGGRYDMHEQLRQFAEARLRRSATMYHALKLAHADYYAGFLHERETALQGADQQTALDQIRHEVENIRAAWRYAVARADADLIGRALHGLYQLYDRRSWLGEGLDAFGRAAECLQSAPDASGVLTGARLRVRQAHLGFRLGAYDEAEAWLDAAVAALDRPALSPAIVRHEQALALNLRGGLARTRGDYVAAAQHAHAALALSRAAAEPLGVAAALNNLGIIARRAGRYAAAEAHHAQSRRLFEQSGNRWELARALNSQGILARVQGRYAEADALLRQAAGIWQATGDREREARCLGNLGLVAHDQGRYAEAIALHERRIALDRDMGNRRGEAVGLYNLANARNAAGEHVEALALHRQNLPNFERLGVRPNIISTHHAIADAALALGRTDEARRHLRQALEIALSLDNSPLLLALIAGAGEYFLRIERPDRAVVLFSTVLAHPAARQETRAAVQALLAGREGAAAAAGRGERVELAQVAAAVLPELDAAPRLPASDAQPGQQRHQGRSQEDGGEEVGGPQAFDVEQNEADAE